MAKVHVADTLHTAADVAIQLHGARGFSKDTVVEWIYRYARRPLGRWRLEVHMMVLASFMREEGRDFWQWGPGEGRRESSGSFSVPRRARRRRDPGRRASVV